MYALSLFEALKKLGQDDFEFIALRAPKPLRRKNILTKFVNLFIELYWLHILLPVRVRQQRIDLLHMPANTISPLVRKPQVCAIHDAHFITTPQGRDPLWRLYANITFKYAARHANGIICGTRAAKDEIIDLLAARPERISVIYHGLPERSSTGADRKKAVVLQPFILSVGSTDPNKNFGALIEAFSLLTKEETHVGHNLVIVGPHGSEHARLLEMISELQLAGRVHFPGKVSDSMLAALYEHASLFAFPSLCEGFGFPPLEAMQQGVPVVASNATCIPETLADAAEYFNPRDIAEISRKIGAVLEDPERMKTLSAAGRKRAAEFSWEKSAAATMSVYRTLLS